MTDILDNANVVAQKDPEGALKIIASQFAQAEFSAVVDDATHDNRDITSVVVTGMGGSALAALIVKVLLQSRLSVPFDIIRGYDLPAYVSEKTLVIASSYSGNTEETLSALQQAEAKGAQLAIVASGGALIKTASQKHIAHVVLPSGVQPRMAMIYNLRGLFALLHNFSVVGEEWLTQLEDLSQWLGRETSQWVPEVPTADNYAKQLALESVGKTPVFYGSPLTAPLAYKWKISWNETAKNTAFWNEFPEFNHNEFMGWTSHPIEKPFVIFDLQSSFDKPRITQRFALSDQLLSGKRPHAQTIQLKGDTLLAQLVWGAILADFASTYTAILNGVDPTPVVLIERLKQELAHNPQ
ncbi:MAG TPA: bifunctional phosphoglucose/phosphomannose isomerase [Dongiaceae bacterium]|nr:bifunctional phosphoglucose/phosphomannose isomerase [Dongiaceae bacterium]